MKSITTSLTEETHLELNEIASYLGVPKNKIIEKAIRLLLDGIKKQRYINSYTRANEDEDLLSFAENGFEIDSEIYKELKV